MLLWHNFSYLYDKILRVTEKLIENSDKLIEKLIEKATRNGDKLTENRITILRLIAGKSYIFQLELTESIGVSVTAIIIE